MGILRILPLAPKSSVSDQDFPTKASAATAAVEGGRRNRSGREMGAPQTPPTSSPNDKPTTLRILFDLESRRTTTTTTTTPFSPNSQTQKLLSIISYCTSVFYFTDPSESPYQQDLKRLKLSQLLAFLKSSKPPLALDDRVLSPLFSLISADLFRPLPPPTTNLLATADFAAVLDDDADPLSSYFNPAWPHLHLVYDILHRLVLLSDPKSLRPHVDRPFLLALLALFQTEDRRERECLKNIFHRIYSRFTFHRSFMRQAMKDVFLQYVFDAAAAEFRHAGIAELLEIWGSIINGFGVPLREEHKVFLTKVLLPMHKCRGMPAYHRQLVYCVSQFLQKEPMLGVVVLRGILRHWPITNCQREELLLAELEELVDCMDEAQYAKLAFPLSSQVAKSFNSWNSQVAERALYIWNNENFVRMVSESIEEVLPTVVESIEKNLKWHWSKTVRQLTSSVKNMLEDMEPMLYSRCLQDLEQRQAMAAQQELKRKGKWERLEVLAAAAQNQLLVN